MFKVDNEILCGIHIDKKNGDSLLMARIGDSGYLDELKKPECLTMDFTGKPMKDYIFVTIDDFDTDKELSYRLDLF